MNLQKPKRFESERYKEFIRNQSCCAPGCGRRRNSKNNKRQVDPHHSKSKGSGGSDLECIPACDCHHTESHSIGQETFQERHNIDYNEIKVKLLQQFIEENIND